MKLNCTEELNIFKTAIIFYTRIPLKIQGDFKDEYLNKSTRYFPLVGIIVGVISIFFLNISLWFLTKEIATLIYIISCILVTGAFHEDGLADFCDGFGGAFEKEKILEIMKDSRIGTYGTLALIINFFLKYFLILNLITQYGFTSKLGILLILTHSISRFVTCILLLKFKYVQEDSLSKIKPIVKNLNIKTFLTSGAIALLPFLFINKSIFFISILPCIFVTLKLGNLFYKKIGGYTGDCLGATEQFNEIVFLISSTILWKYF